MLGPKSKKECYGLPYGPVVKTELPLQEAQWGTKIPQAPWCRPKKKSVIAREEGESECWILVDNQISLPIEPQDD